MRTQNFVHITLYTHTTHSYKFKNMENVIIASFDPTVFSSNTLSDIKTHQTVSWKTTVRDYPRLCTAHLATKMPIVLTTSANIRKYIKAGLFPKVDAIYYDPYTRYYHLPTTMKDYEKNKEKFENIINREPLDIHIVRFFTRCQNIAKTQYNRESTHCSQPKARCIPLIDEDEISLLDLGTTVEACLNQPSSMWNRLL